MEILKIIGIGFLTCIVAVIIKQIKPEFYVVVLLSGGVVILLMLVDQMKYVLEYFSVLTSKTKLDYSMFGSILKIIGVGYLTEFANGICVDSGNASIGDKIVLGGKIVIMCLSIPIISSLLDIIIEILP